MKFLILTHAGCMDGICAGMVARRWCRSQVFPGTEPDHPIEVRQCDYGVPFDEDVTGQTVIVTDFAFPMDTMERLATQASRFIWLDHHASNQPIFDRLLVDSLDRRNGDPPPPEMTFDMDRSGAGITWDELIGTERPWLVNYVEDRDLWRFNLPHVTRGEPLRSVTR